LDVCIERTKARRAAKGTLKDFDPEKTLVPRYRTAMSVRERLLAAGQFDVRDLEYDHADEIVRSWLGVPAVQAKAAGGDE
jgi:hypothetical protein